MGVVYNANHFIYYEVGRSDLMRSLGIRYADLEAEGYVLFVVEAHVRSEAWGGVRQLWPLHLFGVVIATLVVYRHRGNLRRLMEGVEPRIGTSRRQAN